MKPLNWAEIYVVSSKRRLPTVDELATLRQSCGEFPNGYQEFIDSFGFGALDGMHILSPVQVAAQISALRTTLREWACMRAESGEPIVIPPKSIDDGVPLAITDWGDVYFCSPSDPGVLRYICRPHDWDSDSLPSTLPFGFRNPFVHQKPQQEVEVLGQERLVFEPYRDVVSKCFYVRGERTSSNVLETLATLVAAVHSRLQPTRVFKLEDVTVGYLQAWGAEVRVGYRQSDSRYFLFTKVDSEHGNDCDELIAALAQEGYLLEAGW